MLIVYLIVGRLIIWSMQTTELLDFARKRAFFNKLLMCDFCLGFWVYWALTLMFGIRLVQLYLPIGIWYIPVISEAVVGLVSSFMMHMMRIGWEARFNA